MDAKWTPMATLQYVLVGLGVVVALCAFELLLAVAFGAAGLLLGSLVLAVAIVLALRRRRATAGPADGRIPVHELGLNPFRLWARTWRTPANLAGGTVVAIMLILLAVTLLIAGWPFLAVVALDVVVLIFSVIGMLVFYYSAYFLMSLFARLAGGELGVAAWLMTKRRYEEALEWSQRYIDRRRNEGSGWLSAAAVLLGLREYDEALKHADRAIELGAPDEAHTVRATVFAQFGLYEEACGAYAASGDKLKSSPLVYAYYGGCLAAIRRLESAEAVLNEAASLTPGPEAHLSLGATYRLLGRPEEARTAYEEAARRAEAQISKQDSAEAILACCLACLSRPAEAERAAQSAIEKRGDDLLALWAFALTGVFQGDTDRAHGAIAEMLRIRPVSAMFTLIDPLFTPLLADRRFRGLLAWAIGAQRQARERVLARRGA